MSKISQLLNKLESVNPKYEGLVFQNGNYFKHDEESDKMIKVTDSDWTPLNMDGIDDSMSEDKRRYLMDEKFSGLLKKLKLKNAVTTNKVSDGKGKISKVYASVYGNLIGIMDYDTGKYIIYLTSHEKNAKGLKAAKSSQDKYYEQFGKGFGNKYKSDELTKFTQATDDINSNAELSDEDKALQLKKLKTNFDKFGNIEGKKLE